MRRQQQMKNRNNLPPRNMQDIPSEYPVHDQPSIQYIQYGGRLGMLQRYRVHQELEVLDDEQKIVDEMVWQQRRKQLQEEVGRAVCTRLSLGLPACSNRRILAMLRENQALMMAPSVVLLPLGVKGSRPKLAQGYGATGLPEPGAKGGGGGKRGPDATRVHGARRGQGREGRQARGGGARRGGGGEERGGGASARREVDVESVKEWLWDDSEGHAEEEEGWRELSGVRERTEERVRRRAERLKLGLPPEEEIEEEDAEAGRGLDEEDLQWGGDSGVRVHRRWEERVLAREEEEEKDEAELEEREQELEARLLRELALLDEALLECNDPGAVSMI